MAHLGAPGMTDKRKRDDTLAAHNVALHYSGRENQSVGQRQQSPIYHLRCLNNWVKSAINAYVREKDRVLDFACGKGGDLLKVPQGEGRNVHRRGHRARVRQEGRGGTVQRR